ncbi:hypothetical protein [Paracoccus aerodenitrificans]|uniref:hypothetical protein n=1 Tax=Paracoccus aerodenitrificans TaxID=3017781 RepID=UPI0022F049E1|nr:hypothetical protein [Paracoccus aerodenitrificans]WBU64250.1 hypothetical protein PAE61_01995 [Paracoccus aerodenitrificans]
MLINPNHPFFRRLWVRILCVCFPFGWAIFEFSSGNLFWGVIFAAAGAYLFQTLILRGPDER